MATKPGKQEKTKPARASKRRVIAVGKWAGDRWLVRTSMWRYLSTYVVSQS